MPSDAETAAVHEPSGGDAGLTVRNLWKIFGPRADSIVGTPDAQLPRPELKERTGCVAAVKDVSFAVAPRRTDQRCCTSRNATWRAQQHAPVVTARQGRDDVSPIVLRPRST